MKGERERERERERVCSRDENLLEKKQRGIVVSTIKP